MNDPKKKRPNGSSQPQKNNVPSDEEAIDGAIELIGEDGVAVQFEHLMTLEHEAHTYILLTPVNPETPDEEGTVVIMRIEEEAGKEDCYVIEEDEQILDSVFNRFLSIVDEDDDFEDDDTDNAGDES